MQPMRTLNNWLQENTNSKHYLFTASDFRGLFPDLSDSAFKTLLSRTVSGGYLVRVCKGLYVYKKAIPTDGLLLFHVAGYLRADKFNYISLETVLSDHGVISQIPINYISIMSSGRSSIISCGEFGTIEFIHTSQKPTDIMAQLSYDIKCGLWRASVTLALRDMKATHRNCDLINLEVTNELI
jgi:predicted transcriptional regulator of viral defense system